MKITSQFIAGISFTLAHVLRVMKIKSDLKFQEHIADIIIGKGIKRKIVVWNLEKSFDEQEEEIYEFLHTIIC